VNIIFMGTPDFAVPGLRAMLDSGFAPSLVVTQPDRPKGRGKVLTPSPIKELALQKGLPVEQPQDPNAPEFLNLIQEIHPDLIVVIAYGHILKTALLDIPILGCLNIHASLLPELRGPAPIQWAILKGLKETGLTAMWMEAGVDMGNIILQEKVLVEPFETYGSLHQKLSSLSGPFLVRVLSHLKTKGRDPGTPQDHSLATYAPKITKDMCRIDWSRPAGEICRTIRALDPIPGATTTIRTQELKLYGASFKETEVDKHPGLILVARGNEMMVATGKGILMIKEVKLAGKKRLPVSEFIKGFRLKEGEFFE